MDPVADFLSRHAVLVLDGAMATELEARGFDLRDPLWSAKVLLEAPDAIRAVHASYFEAGADCATTASYQATFEGFATRGIGEAEATALLLRSVELACEARDAFWSEPRRRAARSRPLVAASIGSYGAYLADGSEYRGDYGLSERDLARFHRKRMRALAASPADLLAFETVPTAVEARALVRELEALPDRRAWLSFSCRDGAHTCAGEPIEDAVAPLAEHPQLAAIGVNCTPPRHVPELVAAIARVTKKPIAAYPNSGERFDPALRAWSGARDRLDFGAEARRWHAAGARLIGGCCRTTPADIRAVACWAT
jgi:homocysteine S-methyltransferase